MEIHGFTTFGIQSSRSSSEVADGSSFMNLQKIKQNSDQYLQIHSKKKANADLQLNIGDPPDPDSQVKSLPSLPFRVKFPAFDGSQVRLWMLRCAEYFDLYPSISEEEKRELAAMNFVGRAALWYQEFSIKNKYNSLSWISWQQFISIVSARFEDIRIATRADELNQLKYEGNYEDYVGKFEETRKQILQIQNKGLLCDKYAYNETYFLMTFLRGLNGKLKSVVSEFKPTSLQQAIDVGRIKIYFDIAVEEEVVHLQPCMEKESFVSDLVKEEVKNVNASQGVENITTLRRSVIEHNQPSLQVPDTFQGEESKSANNRYESTSLLQTLDFEKFQGYSSQTITNKLTYVGISTTSNNPSPSFTGARTKTNKTDLSSVPLVNLANDEAVHSISVEKIDLVPDTVRKKVLENSATGEEVRLALNVFDPASLQGTHPSLSLTNSQNIITHMALPENDPSPIPIQLQSKESEMKEPGPYFDGDLWSTMVGNYSGNPCLTTGVGKISHWCSVSDNYYRNNSPKACNPIKSFGFEGLISLSIKVSEATNYYCVSSRLQLNQLSEVYAGSACFDNKFRTKEDCSLVDSVCMEEIQLSTITLRRGNSTCTGHKLVSSTQDLEDLLEEFNDVFKETEGLQPTRGVEHQIILKHSSHCYTPYKIFSFIKGKATKNLDFGIEGDTLQLKSSYPVGEWDWKMQDVLNKRIWNTKIHLHELQEINYEGLLNIITIAIFRHGAVERSCAEVVGPLTTLIDHQISQKGWHPTSQQLEFLMLKFSVLGRLKFWINVQLFHIKIVYYTLSYG